MRIFTYILFAIAIGFSSWYGWKLYRESLTLKQYKEDYARINEIKYGLFNLERWKSGLAQIVESKVQDFEISDENFKALQPEIEKYLGQMYDEYFGSGDILDALLNQNGEDSSMANNMFISMLKKNIGEQLNKMDFKANIPIVAEKLVEELKKKSPEIKKVFSDQLTSLVDASTVSFIEPERKRIYDRYEKNTLEKTNTKLKEIIPEKEKEQKGLVLFCVLGISASLLIALFLQKFLAFRELILMLSLSSVLFLALGVSLPMIDLDARLNSVKFEVFGSDISFDEQILYYQSKSIIDVTETLLQGRGFDLKFVGILILLFSIVFPFTKLIVSTVFLFVEKLKKAKWAEIIIYYLGKWSMADVFTVAIFMSYIGFYGILNTQLAEMSADTGSRAIETINYSKLSPGFIFFTAYCIVSIIISIMIQLKMKKSEDLLT